MTLVALYLFTKAQNEMRYVWASVGGLCLFISISLAPWEVLLVFLIPAVVITGKGVQKSDYQFHLQNIQRNNEKNQKKKRRRR
ncbi:MAG: hypothetical protein QNJ49_07045 [Mastigocoleus sp. MO_167.B18]|nr:hypothetical protein [Mastigocoleus sp. MO_167.B18]